MSTILLTVSSVLGFALYAGTGLADGDAVKVTIKPDTVYIERSETGQHLNFAWPPTRAFGDSGNKQAMTRIDLMSSQIYLASQTNRTPTSGICALCCCNFELLSAAVVFYDGHLPLGNLCQECLVGGPGKAASKVRERAKKLYDYANGLRKSPVANQWIAIIKSARERADYWDALAERIEKLSSWDLKDSSSN